MDGSSSIERRKQKHKTIVSLSFITCKSFSYKALRTKLFEGGYNYDMTPRGAYIELSVYDMTPRGEYMGLNVHVMSKCICYRVGLVIQGPHVQCVNRYI
jgi:hypothetical protein